MADEIKRVDANTLLTKIAEKARRDVDDVRSVLARHGVSYKPAIAVPKHLCITSLAFTGEKKGQTAPGPVDFAWRDLSPGLMAIVSDRNFRGKTTLLALMRWCLTGRRGKGVPTEFAETFHTLTMTFTLDGQAYEVEVTDAVAQVGTLWRLDGGNRLAQAAFSSPDGFEAMMSGFFMGQLGLQMLVTHVDRGDKGVDQPHDWVWLSGAMVIEPAPDNLFGNYQALGARMIQMYLGVPWTNAVNDVQAAQTRIEIEGRQAASETERTRERRRARIEEIEAEIAGLRRKLAGLPSAEKQRVDLADANRRFAEAQGRLRSAVRSLAVATEDREAAKHAHDAARRDLREFREGRAAKRVFRSLDPVCCPRCDEKFDDERKQAMRFYSVWDTEFIHYEAEVLASPWMDAEQVAPDRLISLDFAQYLPELQDVFTPKQLRGAAERGELRTEIHSNGRKIYTTRAWVLEWREGCRERARGSISTTDPQSSIERQARSVSVPSSSLSTTAKLSLDSLQRIVQGLSKPKASGSSSSTTRPAGSTKR